MSLPSVPFGFVSVTPNLIVADAQAAIEFYKRVFGALLRLKICTPEGSVAYAELKLGDTFVMLMDEAPELQLVSPLSVGGTAVSLVYFVNDVDAVFQRAAEAGCEVLREVEDQFIGNRSGTLRDPFGHVWTLATQLEDLSEEEIQTRAREFFSEANQTE